MRPYVDDLSGSVLDDPEGDPVTLALVELTRAFLYAYGNHGSLTEARLATLIPLFDVLLDQPEPLATNDVHALLTYVLRAFEKGSRVRMLVEDALRGRPRKMFVSIADSLIEEGRTAGLMEGRSTHDEAAIRHDEVLLEGSPARPRRPGGSDLRHGEATSKRRSSRRSHFVMRAITPSGIPSTCPRAPPCWYHVAESLRSTAALALAHHPPRATVAQLPRDDTKP